jgi:hypothetical protein
MDEIAYIATNYTEHRREQSDTKIKNEEFLILTHYLKTITY